MTAELFHADCLDWLRQQPDDSVDLIFCSPPYEAARTYGIGFNLKGQDWVDWAVERFVECCRVSKGLVAWIVEGQTRNFQWTATPALMMADLHRRGVRLRKPPIYRRVGIPGSGGPDWLRNDFEFAVSAAKGRLPWSQNTAMGKPPKYGPGGELSYRLSSGDRRNKGMMNLTTSGTKNGDTSYRKNLSPLPEVANPGNIIHCKIGGGQMGSQLTHENEAPFPESLAEFFIRSFCPPGGTVLDIFAGSGTTLAAAIKCGRNAIGVDVRESQVELSKRRIEEARRLTPELFG